VKQLLLTSANDPTNIHSERADSDGPKTTIIIIIIIKESEKILKYKDLTIEKQRMWNVKARVIPVVIGATGTISKIIQKIREQHTRKP
jgi:hypothetical protein